MADGDGDGLPAGFFDAGQQSTEMAPEEEGIEGEKHALPTGFFDNHVDDAKAHGRDLEAEMT